MAPLLGFTYIFNKLALVGRRTPTALTVLLLHTREKEDQSSYKLYPRRHAGSLLGRAFSSQFEGEINCSQVLLD